MYKTDGNEPLAGVPTNAGNYLAKITVSNCIASVGYTIAKADPSYTVPTGLTATYGDQLSSVILPEGWAWANGDQPVGNAGANTFKATFTPADTDNYNVITDIDVTVTVDKADAVPATVTANELSFDCTEQALVTVTGEAVGGEMRFALGEDAENAPEDGWSADVPAATKYGTYYVWYKVVADDNHNGTAPECVEVTIFNDTSAIAGTYVSENALVVNGYEDVMMGDVDGSGIVDVTDYLMVKRHVLGTYELSDVQFLAADVDFSGTIDSRDYLMIKRNVLGTYDLPGVPTVTMTITLNVGAEGTGEMITTVEGYENELVTLIDPIEMNESGTWTIYVHLIANVEGVPQEEIMELTLELTEDGCRLLGTNGSRVEFVRVEGVDE
ncbi:MAG: dockerin type I repeat-containing protein [Clostridia bacterium]|nr:dockerin type I repeat-containing protein [Clostridia bacterium]